MLTNVYDYHVTYYIFLYKYVTFGRMGVSHENDIAGERAYYPVVGSA